MRAIDLISREDVLNELCGSCSNEDCPSNKDECTLFHTYTNLASAVTVCRECVHSMINWEDDLSLICKLMEREVVPDWYCGDGVERE